MTLRDQTTKAMASEPNGQRRAAGARDDDAVRAATLVELRRLERLFGEFEWPERRAFMQARKRAHAHALEVLGGGPGEERQTALLVAATDLFVALKVELAAAPGEAARLVERLAENRTCQGGAEVARAAGRAPERRRRGAARDGDGLRAAA
jgi:hypothetical protein